MPPARGAGAAPHGRGAPPVSRRTAGSGRNSAARFFDALREGNVDALQDSPLTSSWSGTAAARLRSSPGPSSAPTLARVLANNFPRLLRIGGAVEPHEVNGQPGAIFRDRDGKVLITLALDVLDGQIQTVRSVSNPDKLRHMGPVADAWAVARELNQARRPTD